MVSDKRWDFYAGFYNPLLRLAAAPRRQVFARLALNEPQRIYLAGCGSGLDLAYLPKGSQVHAVDFSEAMLAKCEQQAKQLEKQGHKLELTLQQRQAELSGLPDNSMDLVILHLILAVTDDPQGLLAEAVRVLKPNGIISVWDKFVPPEKDVGVLRKVADYVSRKLGTTLLLQIDPLLQPHSLAIMQRYGLLHGQMQHLILRKIGQE
ncbi:class I SAM-dependent methyltransferase [Testudinibacter sp. P80/BLE/0925]|uniref:class I SAM-dependent methyltransferase n=1 Tax=Testudinibacter sp. TW-1 TaxID=3417757 RepID=UPI003D36479A